MQIKNFAWGIFLSSSSNNSISENDVTANGEGIVLFRSSNSNSINGNNITKNNPDGIWLGNSSSNTISRNDVTNNIDGIVLESTCNNTVSGNNITANRNYGIGLGSSSGNSISGNAFTDDGLVSDSYQNSVENNTVNGKPLVCLEGVANYSVSNAGQVVLVGCNSITVENLNLSRTNVGLEMWETNDSVISGNVITTNDRYGIWLVSSSGNSISGNTISNNGYGIQFSSSSGNKIYDNNFMNNTSQVFIVMNVWASINEWDNGYPYGGNFWSDYNGSDVYSGPYQNETGHDWIGDSPYVIDANDIDRYPLMNPINPETDDIRIAYRTLLGNYNSLATNLSILSSNYQQNLLDYYSLQSNYTSLQKDLNTLNTSYGSLNSSYTNLSTAFNDYKTSAQNELSYTKNFAYVLTATTAILLVATICLALRKPKTKP
jgi:parallel beta-helix repeat protein